MKRWNAVLLWVLVFGLTRDARGQLSVPGQDWDGSLTIGADTTIDLDRAAVGDWDVAPSDPQRVPGDGIYDASRWAVVFHYTVVPSDSGATLSLDTHATGVPLVWLVS